MYAASDFLAWSPVANIGGIFEGMSSEQGTLYASQREDILSIVRETVPGSTTVEESEIFIVLTVVLHREPNIGEFAAAATMLRGFGYNIPDTFGKRAPREAYVWLTR